MAKAQDKLKDKSQDEQYLLKLRHTAEHILHQAIKKMYPSIHLAMGPATDEGFYFDFDSSPEGKEAVHISESDFPAIQKEMYRIINKNLPMIRQEISVQEARQLFADNPYKQEWIDLIEAKGENVTIYWTGEPNQPDSMVDLCAGPHVDSTGEVKAIKLTSLAGAYWHGDEKNKMLTRVYGTAFTSKEELDHYLLMKEEAKKRDHKKIGREQELFMISPQVGSGFPMYLPNGMLIRRALENWLISEKEKRGFKFVWTPHIGKKDLYVQSGHWQKYDAMFNPMKLDEEEYVVKPMNCPHHFQLFNVRPRSYREMPLILAENATVYRYEKAGELNGLLRVRALTQDDTHAFVRHSMIAEEIDKILDLTFYVYETFGFKDFKARISVRDPNDPNKYMGNPETWDKAEAALINSVEERNIEYFVGEGEAAFYGPKIDVMVKDALGREWQLTTVQLDFVQPENFDLNFINEDGEKERPAVLHVAILGSVDRFLGILIEHFAGAFPTWLAPTQAVVLPISDKHIAYAQEVKKALESVNVRVKLDDRSERLSAKIRDSQLEKVPYMLVVGDAEAENKTVAVRKREGGAQEVVGLEEFVTMIVDSINKKG